MYSFRRCSHTDCSRLVFFDTDTCYLHADGRGDLDDRVRRYLAENETVKNINLAGFDFSGTLLEEKRFFACNFSEAVFRKCNLTHVIFTLCFLDFVRIEESTFTNSYMLSTVLSASTIRDTDFTNSDLLHSNFNGLEAVNVDFSYSDLYFTYFIRSHLRDVKFVDCNLKKTNFTGAELENVSFKYSNYEEADFSGDVSDKPLEIKGTTGGIDIS